MVRQEFYGLLLGQFSTACYPLGAVQAALLAALVNTHEDFYRLGGEMGSVAFPSCAPDSSRVHT